MRHEFEELVGKTMTSVTQDGYSMTFVTSEGKRYMFHHVQDCCENVSIEDICGELEDLVGSPLTVAEQVDNLEDGRTLPDKDSDGSFTWTFYRFASAKGWVTVRWYGSSNGYYGEGVDFTDITNGTY